MRDNFLFLDHLPSPLMIQWAHRVFFVDFPFNRASTTSPWCLSVRSLQVPSWPFSPKFLGRWSSRKCYSQHRFLRLAPTPVPDIPGAMFRLASWHCAARLPMWQRSGRCLCCRLVDGVDIVFLPTEFDQAGAFSSRQEQFPAQKPSRWMVWLFINHIRTMAES